MSKVSIIYWSGTGNTESMANLIKDGIVFENGEVAIKPVSEALIDDVVNSEIIVLGCPSMGNEELEDSEMEPFIQSIEDKVDGKKLVLFGSYGWGDGQWMRDWEERMKAAGANLIEDSLIINDSPDKEEDKNSCINLGKNLAKM
jgi:flavodoxin I